MKKLLIAEVILGVGGGAWFLPFNADAKLSAKASSACCNSALPATCSQLELVKLARHVALVAIAQRTAGVAASANRTRTLTQGLRTQSAS